MARLIERAFDPKRPLVARRHLVAAGRHFKIGDPFDWRRMSVDQRRVRQLFDAGKLMHTDEDAPEPAPEPVKAEAAPAAMPAEAPAPVPPAPAPEPEPEPEPEDDEPQDDLTGLDIKELRNVAYAEGAPTRRSQAAQRAAIRENRAAAG